MHPGEWRALLRDEVVQRRDEGCEVGDLGERVEAHSNFLWAIVLGLGGKLGADVPMLGKLLSVLCVAGTILLLGVMRPDFEGKGREPWALVAPLLYLFHPVVHYQCDRALETSFYVLLLGLACFFWVRRRALGASLALAGVAATRPEGFGFFGFLLFLLS